MKSSKEVTLFTLSAYASLSKYMMTLNERAVKNENFDDEDFATVLEDWDIWNHLPQISCIQVFWMLPILLNSMADGFYLGLDNKFVLLKKILFYLTI